MQSSLRAQAREICAEMRQRVHQILEYTERSKEREREKDSTQAEEPMPGRWKKIAHCGKIRRSCNNWKVIMLVKTVKWIFGRWTRAIKREWSIFQQGRSVLVFLLMETKIFPSSTFAFHEKNRHDSVSVSKWKIKQKRQKTVNGIRGRISSEHVRVYVSCISVRCDTKST